MGGFGSRKWLWSAGVTLILTTGAVAQVAEDAETLPLDATEDGNATAGDPFVRFTPFTRYTFPSDLDGANDDYRTWRAGFNYLLKKPVSREAQIKFSLGYEYSNYDFDRPNTFIAGAAEPFGDIHIIDARLGVEVAVDDEWSWTASGIARFAGESDVDYSDADSYGGIFAIQREFNEDFTASLGVLVATQIEDDELILPAITLDWSIDDQWSFVVDGTRGELRYDYGDGLVAVLGAAYENRRFRLDNDPVKLGSVVEDTAVPIYIAMRYRADNSISIDLTGGVLAFQEFEIENRNGNAGREFESDPAPFIGLGVSFNF
ncbi:MAG: DUF6268 family outer membrane beta-barrel protein [Phycisphaerales bacterium]